MSAPVQMVAESSDMGACPGSAPCYFAFRAGRQIAGPCHGHNPAAAILQTPVQEERLQRRGRPRPDRWGPRAAGGALAGLLAGGLVSARAQSFFNPYASPLPQLPGLPTDAQRLPGDDFLINRGLPYNSGTAQARDYNFKLGPAKGSVYASMGMTYTDNLNAATRAAHPAAAQRSSWMRSGGSAH